MDGFEVLIKTEMWEKLRAALDAVFEFQKSMERNGFGGDSAYASRLRLGDAENQLRGHFKRKT